MVYKMLEMLPKRGPDAFDHFVDIIQNDYPWLAATLQSSLKSEMAKSCRIDSHKSDFTGNSSQKCLIISCKNIIFKNFVQLKVVWDTWKY